MATPRRYISRRIDVAADRRSRRPTRSGRGRETCRVRPLDDLDSR